MKTLLITLQLLICCISTHAQYITVRDNGVPELTMQGAEYLAKLALKGLHLEYPNKPGNTLDSASDVRSPRELTPAFYGCYDWHSSVHGHWMLVKILKEFPTLSISKEIREAIDQNISSENMAGELSYFKAARNKSFERTYGWAWYLKLVEELSTWDDAQGQQWFNRCKPLADLLVERYLEFLPKQSYPIRTGTHQNTAFGLIFALDYARAMEIRELDSLICVDSRRHYLSDKSAPVRYEPHGADFLSPTLVEIDLMQRILPPPEFRRWLRSFVNLSSKSSSHLLRAATVSDRSDMQIVHLDGLNLSKSWALINLSAKLGGDKRLLDAAHHLLATTIPHIASGDYAGEHWLASFAVYALTVNNMNP